uniref:Phospholipase A2 n=1 Tax=Sphenodon punctatus TaxID=8508 RepID=A0A8D0G721_SPHPU
LSPFSARASVLLKRGGCLLKMPTLEGTSTPASNEADCYVSLWMPTSSKEELKTKAILNTSEPVWNETFYFGIQNQVKNILELKVYDEDPVTKDDLLFTILFDIAEIRPGERVHTTFTVNSKVGHISQIAYLSPPPQRLIARREANSFHSVSCFRPIPVMVSIFHSVWFVFSEEDDLELRVKGSYEETRKTLLDSDSQEFFHFHYPSYWEPVLNAHLQVTFPPLLIYHYSEDLDMRLGFDLCAEEQDFLQKRKKVVASALKHVLQLEEDLLDHEVPVVAVMAVGGGSRAMTSLYGQLSGLKKLNFLDCVTYISGTSGSTWTMTNLYEDANWSQKDLEGPINEVRRHVTKNKLNTFSLERLLYYQRELCQRAEEGITTSFNDLWAVVLESILHDGVYDFKLSDQQQAVSQGQNPLPLYLALNVKENHISTFDFKEWCEFSPYEVGFLKYGAFIRSEDFGSEFFMGRLMKKNPESRICFLEALWSNIFALNLLDIWNSFSNADESWQQYVQDKVKNIEHILPNSTTYLGTSWLNPSGMLSKIIRDILTNRPLHHHVHNFLKGLQMHQDYYQHSHFSQWKDCQLDLLPNQLTPSEDDLCLVDAAYFINTSCPPLLRKERNVDIILSFDYSLSSRFQCYLFADEENPEAPLVLYFPLVNDTFKNFKMPGVRRSATETDDGAVPLNDCCSPYHLLGVTYNKNDFDKLLKLSDYNVQNNRDLILQAFHTAIECRKRRRK